MAVRISKTEYEQMAAGTYMGNVNPACRIMEMIPKEVREKYKGQASAINTAFKTLENFCVKGKNRSGKNRQSTIYDQSPNIAKHMKILIDAGLGHYFYQPEFEQQEKTRLNQEAAKRNQEAANQAKRNQEAYLNNQQSALNIPVQNFKTVFLNSLKKSPGNLNTKLKAIDDYIQYWEGATEQNREEKKVSQDNLQKLQLLKPVVKNALQNKNITVPDDFNNNEWFPIVEKVWTLIPGSNVNPPEPHNNQQQRNNNQNQGNQLKENNQLQGNQLQGNNQQGNNQQGNNQQGNQLQGNNQQGNNQQGNQLQGNNQQGSLLKGNNNQQIKTSELGEKIKTIETKLQDVIQKLKEISTVKGGKRTRRVKKGKRKMTYRKK